MISDLLLWFDNIMPTVQRIMHVPSKDNGQSLRLVIDMALVLSV